MSDDFSTLANKARWLFDPFTKDQKPVDIPVPSLDDEDDDRVAKMKAFKSIKNSFNK